MLKCLNVSSSYTGPERVKQRARVTRWYLFVILQTSAPPVRQAATPTPPYSSCGYCTNIWFTNSIAKYALVYLTVIFPPPSYTSVRARANRSVCRSNIWSLPGYELRDKIKVRHSVCEPMVVYRSRTKRLFNQKVVRLT